MTKLSGLQNFAASLIDSIPGVYEPQDDLETQIADLALRTVLIAGGTLFVLTILALLFSNKFPKLKLPLFVMMSLAMAGSTFLLIGSTVYLNINADSGGPVHWHADIEFWACGNELELRDPTGFLSNKIGTATLHEHDDHRIHLEGVVVDRVVDASLGKFMHVVGGAVTDESLVVPLNADGEGNIFEDEEDGDGPSGSNADAISEYIIDDEELGKIAVFNDGQQCGDESADVQVYVYSYNGDDKSYQQTKLSGIDVRDYVIEGDPNVPPGDCVIFEFGPTRAQTDKLCEQYGIRDIERCESFGVEPRQREICELTQKNYDPENNDSAELIEVEETSTEADEEANEAEPEQEVVLDGEGEPVDTSTLTENPVVEEDTAPVAPIPPETPSSEGGEL